MPVYYHHIFRLTQRPEKASILEEYFSVSANGIYLVHACADRTLGVNSQSGMRRDCHCPIINYGKRPPHYMVPNTIVVTDQFCNNDLF